MKEFLLVFRGDYKSMPELSPEEMQATTQKWINWVASFAAQNKLSDRGNRLVSTGKVMTDNDIISDGPYTEIKESIMGYTIIKSESIEEASVLVQDCPVFSAGGSLEIREISVL
ncbi:YciI family protein [Flavobacterium aestivum]|uniref:YciI family protein n=1 Tax=Flavobacterium aestivum TaxID=3003257 RepID=UPI002482AE1F|nr:YciI family protein [Flavobacterium aestivum]